MISNFHLCCTQMNFHIWKFNLALKIILKFHDLVFTYFTPRKRQKSLLWVVANRDILNLRPQLCSPHWGTQGYSCSHARLGISLHWTSWDSSLPNSTTCQGPSEWQQFSAGSVTPFSLVKLTNLLSVHSAPYSRSLTRILKGIGLCVSPWNTSIVTDFLLESSSSASFQSIPVHSSVSEDAAGDNVESLT